MNFLEIANQIGQLVEEKNIAYGNATVVSSKILQILFPNGVKSDQFYDMLLIVRVIDKLCRIANKKEAFNESPWTDIAGYGIIGAKNSGQEDIRKEQ